ncbi:MAG: hypothetical protein WC599_09190 [Bacteroidales bacterium]
MLKLKSILVVVSLALIWGNSFSQSQKYEFKNSKPIPDGKVVYFEISGIKDNDHSEELVKVLSQIDGVSFCRIFKSSLKTDACQLNINSSVSADYVRAILLSNEADFDLESVKVNNPANIEKRRDGMPEHYPVFVNTGNTDADNAQYEMDKQEWIKKYPEEVAKITGREIDEFVNKKEHDLPIYIDTGNPIEDQNRFEKDKKKWEENKKSK